MKKRNALEGMEGVLGIVKDAKVSTTRYKERGWKVSFDVSVVCKRDMVLEHCILKIAYLFLP
jgi:hypothetical protein